MISQDFIRSLFRPEVLALSAYKVADASNLIKLDAMENPYHWPEAMVSAWLEHLRHAELNRYPDPSATQLTATLKTVNQIPAGSEVLLGNGSDEIIQLLLMALPAGATVLAPEPGFVMYKQVAMSLGLQFCGVPLLPASFDLDLPAMLSAIAQHQPGVIFIAYPNNPTGNLFSAEAIAQIIAHAPGLVVIDEAYAPFANASFMQELSQHAQVLVMRTVSKLGLAGLRLGFIAGHEEIITQLNKIRLPYNINILTQLSADFALAHSDVFIEQSTRICAEREQLLNALQALPGITAYPSKANFILFRTPAGQAERIFLSIKQQGVLIKFLNASGGLLQDCLRVTVGTPEENVSFLHALQNSLVKIA